MIPDLAKFLFPRLQPSQRRREMLILIASLLVGLVLAGIIAGVMILTGRMDGH